ncbi:integrase [Bradyrhizobium sp. F1.13.1]
MSKSPVYEREVKSLNENDVQSAISYSASGAIAGKVAEWRDKKTTGLTLRITPGKAVWYVRRREITLRLGSASEINLDQARYFAGQTNLAAKRKRDLREFVDQLVRLTLTSKYKDELGHQEAADQFADETSLLAYRKRTGDTGVTWTWKALTAKFLEYKLPKLKAKYREKYARFLQLDEYASVNEKLVGEIKLRDLERLRDDIFSTHKKSTVNRAVTQSKSMLTWAWKFHATDSGLDDVEVGCWHRWSFEYASGKRTHAPTIEEIARTLVIAEKFRKLAEEEHETYPGTLGALWAVALTAQRTGGLLQLRADRLFDPDRKDRKLRGWKIANWTEEEMKGGRDGGRPFSLPIPPEALAILAAYHKESGGESEWMFSGRVADAHISQSALNLLLHRLQGRVYDHTVKQKPQRKGKPGPKPKPKKLRPNLFALYGIEPWTPHECRTTMTTFLDDRRLGGAATAILGHKMVHDRVDERERMATVTEQHYNRSQRIGLKAEGMTLWVKALLAAYKKEKQKFRDLRQAKLAA